MTFKLGIKSAIKEGFNNFGGHIKKFFTIPEVPTNDPIYFNSRELTTMAKEKINGTDSLNEEHGPVLEELDKDGSISLFTVEEPSDKQIKATENTDHKKLKTLLFS